MSMPRKRQFHLAALLSLLALVVLASTFGVAGQIVGQEHVGEYAQADLIRGAQLYSAQCAVCHGLNGNAVGTVDLRSGRFARAVSDDDVKRIIQSGVPAAGMPPFALADAELTAIVAFIRAGMDVNASARSIAVGDASRGRGVFESSKGGCLGCHRVNGQGGRSAPDLSEIGSVRTPMSLHTSLIDPTSAMIPLNRPIRAVTRRGTTITGRRLNEDTYNILIADEDGRLVSLSKADLRDYEVLKTSPMPSYRDKLTVEEIADVFAYLLSLKGQDAASATAATAAQGQQQITYERLLNASSEPHNWLTYSGGYASHRHTALTELTPANVANLEQKWTFQGNVQGAWQSSPLVVDGVMYITQRPNDVIALNAATGRAFWIYRYPTPQDQVACCGSNNRGVAILGETLYMGTLDAHLVALDARSGKPIWNKQVAPYRETGYSITLAPLVVKDKVLVGVGGGERGIRGFLAAFDARTGKELWRRYTIPAPGEPGADSWSGDAWKTGGAPIWVTGSYDPALNLTYWGTGNPGPDWNPAQRPGDNLYTDSVIAVDPDTGVMKWHFQFTPNDAYDYDSVQVPVLADMNWSGRAAKLMLWANRNGFFYVLDRETGKFLLGKPFVKVNWASGLDPHGRPIQTPPADDIVWPGVQGGTNWYSPSFSPRTGLFYVSAWENYAAIIRREPSVYQPGGRGFTGGGWTTLTPVPNAAGTPALRRGAFNAWTEATGTGAVIAIDPRTGEHTWKFTMTDVTDSGILTTASDLLFTGGREGFFQALDARTGRLLWKANAGGQIVSGPISYAVDGKQYVAVISGLNLISFALRD